VSDPIGPRSGNRRALGDHVARQCRGVFRRPRADRMEDRGWVTRRPNPNDRRCAILALTGVGRAIGRAADATFEMWLDQIVAAVACRARTRNPRNANRLKVTLTWPTADRTLSMHSRRNRRRRSIALLSLLDALDVDGFDYLSLVLHDGTVPPARSCRAHGFPDFQSKGGCLLSASLFTHELPGRLVSGHHWMTGVTRAGADVSAPYPRGPATPSRQRLPPRWHEGECLVFDDHFEHEARNQTAQDRVVLIVDLWHSDRSAARSSYWKACNATPLPMLET